MCSLGLSLQLSLVWDRREWMWGVFCPSSHPVVQVPGQRVDQQDLADGGGSVQTDGGVEVSVPEHGASRERHEQSHDQNRQQSHEPAQHSHTRRTRQITHVAAACRGTETSARLRTRKTSDTCALHSTIKSIRKQFIIWSCGLHLLLFYIVLYSHYKWWFLFVPVAFDTELALTKQTHTVSYHMGYYKLILIHFKIWYKYWIK